MKRTLILSSGVVLLLVLRRTLWRRIAPVAAQSGSGHGVAFSNTGVVTATNVVITDALSANIIGAICSSSGVPGCDRATARRY